MFVNGYFMLFFDLTPDHGTSEGHTSHPDSGNVRIEAKFKKPLTTAYCTRNTTPAFLSIHRETLRQTFNSINGHPTDYVLSAVREFVSRRLPVGSISPAFYRTF